MISTPITQSELETYLWGAAILLRGYIDAGDYKQFIFPLMFFKRLCDVYDEERALSLEELGDDFPENHRFIIPDDAHWRDVREVTSNVGMAIQSAMREIEKANPVLDGIFGDAPWTNKDRLSDATLINLIEHFSTQTLSRERVNEDLLGQAYEYLIKKFADDSGHTAAEFYTNRTVVHLMTALLDPQQGESVYDPTCGSGGMLLSAAEELKRRGQDIRTLKMYGQEINLMTSAIARMNMFMHGFEDFKIVRGDTLANPYFRNGNRLQQFDVIVANPPYSINSWNRAAFESDPYGRNLYGTPPQGRADYAFWQHIIASLKLDTGRCAILFPHGVLFRNEERHMRESMVKADVIEAVIGLGPNLFYNSPMEACVVVCRMNKPTERHGKILFINALNEVTRERAFSYLTDSHLERIANAYHAFEDVEGFARVVTVDEVMHRDANLNIPLYVRPQNGEIDNTKSLESTVMDWQQSSAQLRQSMNSLFEVLETQPQLTADIGVSYSALPGIEKLVAQISQAAKIYRTPQQQFNESLGDLSGYLQKLSPIIDPLGSLSDSLRSVLSIDAKLGLGISGLNGIEMPGMKKLTESIAATNFSAFLALDMPLMSSTQILSDQLNKVVATLNSSAYVSALRPLLEISTMDSVLSVQNLLNSVALDNGANLKALVGENEEIDLAIDVLADTKRFEDLPKSIQENANQLKAYVYEHGISITLIFWWVINCLWLVSERDFEASSAVINNLLTLLLVLQALTKERKDK